MIMRDRTYTIRNAMNIVKYYTDKLIKVQILAYARVNVNDEPLYGLVIYKDDGEVLHTTIPRDIALALRKELDK